VTGAPRCAQQRTTAGAAHSTLHPPLAPPPNDARPGRGSVGGARVAAAAALTYAPPVYSCSHQSSPPHIALAQTNDSRSRPTRPLLPGHTPSSHSVGAAPGETPRLDSRTAPAHVPCHRHRRRCNAPPLSHALPPPPPPPPPPMHRRPARPEAKGGGGRGGSTSARTKPTEH